LVILVSVFAPSAIQWLGLVGLFVGLIGVYAIMFKRPVGRPSGDAARRISGYVVRPSVTVLPEAVLLGFAVWELWSAVPGSVPTSASLAFSGAILGAAWGFTSRVGAMREIGKVLVGGCALAVSFLALVRGDQCADARSAATMYAITLLFLGSVAAAILIAFWKWATLRRANFGAYLLALFGLIELVQFAIAPAGEDILGGAPFWADVILVVGFLVVALVGAFNPAGAEAMIGTGIAAGSLYLALAGTQLQLDAGVGCRTYGLQLVLVIAFTVAAFMCGGRRR
jgi:hypothetical protein